MSKRKLNPHPARTDLTDRECAKLLSAHVGGLCQMADVETVRKAVQWLGEVDEYWRWMKSQSKLLRNLDVKEPE